MFHRMYFQHGTGCSSQGLLILNTHTELGTLKCENKHFHLTTNLLSFSPLTSSLSLSLSASLPPSLSQHLFNVNSFTTFISICPVSPFVIVAEPAPGPLVSENVRFFDLIL